MVIVKVWGGIGNQLFQYVFGQYLHYRYNVEVRYDDNSYVSNDKLRKSELCALDSNIVFDNQCSFSRYRGLKNRLMRFWFQLNPMKHYVCEENRMPERFKKNHIYFFQGYWQNYKYYDWLKQNINDFKIKSSLFPEQLWSYDNQISSIVNSVSVHIRRGDYFAPHNIGIYGVCSESYYINAMKKMQSLVPNALFFIFSDDINWVKNHIEMNDNTIIIPNYNISQFAYIELMSYCKHHIVSNSSFSWWGAVLYELPESKVIAPKRWTFTSEETIALDKWIKMPV